MTEELNLPPDEKSIYIYVKKEWEEIFSNWEDGYNLEERLEDLNHFIEENREKYIKKNSRKIMNGILILRRRLDYIIII